MSSLRYPDDLQIDYHADLQHQRVARALQRLDPGDVLAAMSTPAEHPLYAMVCWHLEKRLTPLDGGVFFDTFNRIVAATVETCLDEALSREDD